MSRQYTHIYIARRAASDVFSSSLQTLRLFSIRYQTLGVVVPALAARAPRTDLRLLRGLGFAVKGAYRLRGLKKWHCNTIYRDISSFSDTTATIVRDMVAAGTHVLATTKLSSMIGKEEPTEATPGIVVPIEEYEYDSRVSGRMEFLPVAVSIVGDSRFRCPFD